MKKVISLVASMVAFQCAFAQVQDSTKIGGSDNTKVQTVGTSNEETPTEKPKNGGKPKLKPYGFVRNFFYYDSRQNITSNGGLYNQIPKDQNLNEIGEDLNEVSQSSFLSFTTRLGLDVSGVRLLNADATAKIEADFCGFSGSTTMLRIRQAYMKLQWKHNSLLAGQAWHPMSGEVPDVLGLASGSPFEPFSRTPQIRFDSKVNGWNFTTAALWQFTYMSIGPNGKSTEYLNHAIMPEFYIGFDYTTQGGLNVGAGVDLLRIQPRTTMKESLRSEDPEVAPKEITRKVDEYAFSASPMVYLKYKNSKETLKVYWKAVFGQNTSHLNMMSGLGVTEVNPDGSYEYKPLRNFTTFLNFSWGKKFKGNLFGGFFKNLGMSEELANDGALWVNGASNIDYIWRVAPAISYNVYKFTFGLEYELTGVGYGIGHDKYGKADADHDILNNRAVAMIKFAW